MTIRGKKIALAFDGDKTIWVILFFLSLMSLAAVYSSTGKLAYVYREGNTEYYLFRRFIFILTGWVLAYFTHKISIKYIKMFAVFGLVITIPLLAVNLFMETRWAVIPYIGVSVQISELAKITLLVYTAWQLALNKDYIKEAGTFIKLILPVFIVTGFIFIGDFSTAALIFITNLALILFNGPRLKHLLVMTAGIVVFFAILILLIYQYPDFRRFSIWKERIESRLHPDQFENSGNYQIRQAKIAIAGGGLTGKLPGKSTQRYILPEAHNDFIYAIIIEEYGSVVGLGLMFLYLIFLYRSIRIFLKSTTLFNGLLVLGIGFSISLQAMINMGVSVGVFPVTGMTLPAISQGGSSVLITFVAIGMIQAVAVRNQQTKMEDSYE
jgi:cell division protein FtsW